METKRKYTYDEALDFTLRLIINTKPFERTHRLLQSYVEPDVLMTSPIQEMLDRLAREGFVF